MKKLLIVTALLLWSANLAFAQYGLGTLTIKAAPQAVCSYVFPPPPAQVLALYVVHVNHNGATGVRFSALKPPCFNAVFLGDTPQFVEISGGSSQTGVTVTYGACLPAPVTVLIMNFLVLGTTPPCCYYHVLADPANPSGHIEAADCASQVWSISETPAIISATPNCYDGVCYPVPVDETTWGHVKAMFVD